MESPGHEPCEQAEMHTEPIKMPWKNIQCNAYLNKYTVFSVNKENKLKILGESMRPVSLRYYSKFYIKQNLIRGK